MYEQKININESISTNDKMLQRAFTTVCKLLLSNQQNSHFSNIPIESTVK